MVDRFPLVANRREVLATFFLAHPLALQQAAANTAHVVAQSVEPVPVTEMYRGRHHSPQHWLERQGNVSGQQLWHAIEAQGSRHSSSTGRRFLAGLSRASEAGRPPEVELAPYTRPQGPSARSVSFLVVSRSEKRSRLGQLSLEQLCQVGAQMAQLSELALSFLSLVRERRGAELDAWRTQAAASEIPPFVRFAEGLKDDLAAMQAGLTLPWSNGVTEGHINRLQLLKRQGYGRANVALLRQRLVPARESTMFLVWPNTMWKSLCGLT